MTMASLILQARCSTTQSCHVLRKTRRSLNYGITATFSVPDRGLADQCKRAVNTNIRLQEQLLATKRLEHELFQKMRGTSQGRRAVYGPNVSGMQ